MSFLQELLQLLRDPIWQSIGALFGAVALGLTVGLYVWDRRRERKKVSLEVMANVPLFRVSPRAGKKLRVLYGDREISNLSLIQYRIQNTGRLPIPPADIVKPIRICLSPKASIVETGIVSLQPPDLNVQVSQIDDSTVELTKSLLNPGDSVVGKIVAADNDGSIRTEARIVGVSSIKTIQPTGPGMYAIFGSWLIAALSTGVAAFLFNLAFGQSTNLAWLLAGNTIALAFLGLDKSLARIGRVRIPEMVFYLMSALGGSIGIFVGIRVFNHKTRRLDFQITNLLILIAQIVIYFALVR